MFYLMRFPYFPFGRICLVLIEVKFYKLVILFSVNALFVCGPHLYYLVLSVSKYTRSFSHKINVSSEGKNTHHASTKNKKVQVSHNCNHLISIKQLAHLFVAGVKF